MTMYLFPGDESSFQSFPEYGVEWSGNQLGFINAYNKLKMQNDMEQTKAMVEKEYNKNIAYGEKTGTIPPQMLNNELGIDENELGQSKLNQLLSQLGLNKENKKQEDSVMGGRNRSYGGKKKKHHRTFDFL